MTDPDHDYEHEYDHLIPLVTREYATATGGAVIADGPARRLLHRILSGRTVSSPAAYVVRAIRDAPDPFALLDDNPPPEPAPHRPRLHPSSRPVSDVIPNYRDRIAQVRAYYAEDARRKAAGEPFQWQDREAAKRALAARQAAEWHDANPPLHSRPAAADVPPPGGDGQDQDEPIDADAWDADAWDEADAAADERRAYDDGLIGPHPDPDNELIMYAPPRPGPYPSTAHADNEPPF